MGNRTVIETTKHFWQLEKSDKRISVFQGGSRSGKTYNIMLWLVNYAINNPGSIISVVRATMPSLEATAYRDFKDILNRMGIWDSAKERRKPMEYTFAQGSTVEFFGVDMEEKVRGRARNILFINEANELKFKEYTQLVLRTDTKIILDYNPSLDFWVFDRVLIRDDVDFYKSTWRDNAFIPKDLITEIEALKDIDEALYKIYGLGELANIQGIIFEHGKHWDLCDELPEEYDKRRFGLDWGFANDPNALVEIRYAKGELWLKEHLYKKGLVNNEIAGHLPKDEIIIGDSAEPKSIEEIRRLGYNIKPSKKGADSINNGIILLKQYKMNVTKDSVNIQKEFKNYRWREDRSGDLQPKPIDAFNHCVDCSRYIVQDMFFERNIFFM